MGYGKGMFVVCFLSFYTDAIMQLLNYKIKLICCYLFQNKKNKKWD
jgi:hypothetical protein